MSLDTVLKIGNALRNAPDSLRHFKYVSPCPIEKNGNYPFCISIPVLDDFSFDWENVKETQENQKNKLYYLRFKTSDSDGLMKYIYGDIYYVRQASIKKDNSIETSEAGGYRLEDAYHSNAAYRPSSFNRGNSDYEEIIKDVDNAELILIKFRNALNKDLSIIETVLANISAVEYFLKNPSDISFLSFIQNEESIKDYTVKQLIEKTSKANLKKLGIQLENNTLTEEQKHKLFQYNVGEIFIHFELPDGKHWYDYKKDFELINKKILSDFVDNVANGWVLKKTLYKTLCSGDKKNDIQFPNFELGAKFKSKSFDDDSIQDLFYAIDYSKKGMLIPWTDIKIIILPNGKNLNADDYINFQIKGDEENINQANIDNQGDVEEPLFDIFDEGKNDNIISFDVVFSKKGGATSPDVDLSEISGVEKSNIRRTRQRIADIANNVYQNRKSYFINTTKDFYRFRISSSFKNILGNPQADIKTGKVSFKAGSKYQSHMLKVLPLIYTGSYYQDNQLLSAFIQNVEYSIRAGDSQFNFLKFDLEFLISIQNNKNNRYMDIINSNSYQIGVLLGGLAKNFAGDESPIKSFEKNYVGNLSRRISTIDDFIKLKNDIEQKLIMHEKTKYTHQTSYELSERVKTFQGTYDKEEAVFGFFESYFKPLPKKKEETSEEQSN